ncbi:hypothetical protein M2408_002653 [Sphingobacterium sp. BIGb0165]|nr:hypothetical protein [Sphingobacterium sp. BIGb0165]
MQKSNGGFLSKLLLVVPKTIKTSVLIQGLPHKVCDFLGQCILVANFFICQSL